MVSSTTNNENYIMKKPPKPTGRAIWASRINLTNSFSPTWQAKWPHAETRRIRKEAIAVIRAARAWGLL